jgi:hypothetical protein
MGKGGSGELRKDIKKPFDIAIRWFFFGINQDWRYEASRSDFRWTGISASYSLRFKI